MKRILLTVLSFLMLCSITACSTDDNGAKKQPNDLLQPQTETLTEADNSGTTQTDNENKALIVYFSWSGNTQSAANEIKEQTGADIFEIEAQTAYTDDYNRLLDIAKNEQDSNARPAIAKAVDNFEQYDVIYLGYPNWWGDMPMILYTFLDEYDFTGKTIAPFVTSGGSGFSNTINTIEKLEPNATVTKGLALASSEAANCSSDVSQWLLSIGL